MTAFINNVRTSAGALRGNTGLRRLSLTATIAELSAPVYYTAALVWAFGVGGAMLAAIFGIVAMLPAAVAAPFLAVVTDRSRKARVVAVSLAARGVLLLVLAAGVALGSNVLVLVAAAAASICARTLYPALAALIPSLARSREELVAANALVSGIENVGLVVGPALAGAALVVVSPAVVCAAAALGALAAGAAALRLEATGASVVSERAAEDKTSVAAELVAGFAMILAGARTRSVVAVHAVHCLGLGALAVVVVQLAIDDLRLGSPGFGLLEAAIALGGVAGGVVAVGRLTGHDTFACIRGGALVWGVSLALVAVAVGPATALLGLAALGVGNVFLDVVTYTYVQEATAEAVLARTIAAMQSIAVAAVGIGNLVAGIALATLGTRATLVLLALGLPAVAAVLLRPRSSAERRKAFSPSTVDTST